MCNKRTLLFSYPFCKGHKNVLMSSAKSKFAEKDSGITFNASIVRTERKDGKTWHSLKGLT